MPTTIIPSLKTRGLSVSKLLRDVLAREQFSDLGDLRDAVERECQKYDLPCSREAINLAFDVVQSNTPLLAPRPPPVASTPPVAAAPPVGHAEAKQILDDFGIDVGSGRLREGRVQTTAAASTPDAPANFPRLVRA